AGLHRRLHEALGRRLALGEPANLVIGPPLAVLIGRQPASARQGGLAMPSENHRPRPLGRLLESDRRDVSHGRAPPPPSASGPYAPCNARTWATADRPKAARS